MKSERPKPKLIVISGPTGIGKTAVAIAVAEAFGGEIIGADSMQIYRYMDIGTAKPTAEEQVRVTHHMIDVIDPDENFDAARYAHMARACVRNLVQNDILPIIAGGTGLYIKALLYGLSSEAITDKVVRNRLKIEATTKGSRILHKRLASCDPAAATRIHPNDTFRIIRALEVYEITGRPMSSIQTSHQFGDHLFDALKIGLSMDRETLYAQIDRRVEDMIATGLVDEVKGLLDQGYGSEIKAMQSIGYRHITSFLEGKLSREEAIRTMKRDTRRYAKRQMTWFKRDPDIIWVAPDNQDRICKKIAAFLDDDRIR